MKLEIDENKLNKIKEFIEKNERFKGNEDLYDRFVDEVKTRGFIIFNSIDFNDPSSKEYVNKIVSASILQVLKQENRLETESKPTEEVSEKGETEETEETPASEERHNRYSTVKVKYDFDYVPAISGVKMQANTLQKFYDDIVILNNENPEKEFLQIYTLKYIKKMSIEQISRKLNLDENVVSKNLYELMERVKTIK